MQLKGDICLKQLIKSVQHPRLARHTSHVNHTNMKLMIWINT